MSRNKQVSELMNRQVVTIDKGEIVEVALDLMERNDINHLVVTSDEKVVGILSIRDIMEGLGSFRFQKIPARRIYVSALMTEPPVTIKPTNTIDEAIEVMSEQEIGSLPVVDDGRLLGIITETDIIRLLSANESIENLVKEDHPKIMPNERIVHARSIMLERGARILPVVESGKLVGLLTERDLAKAFLDVRENIDPVYMDNVVRRIVVDDIMVESPTRLRGFVSVIEARDMFIDSGLPALPVVDQEDKVIGVLMRRSLLRLI